MGMICQPHHLTRLQKSRCSWYAKRLVLLAINQLEVTFRRMNSIQDKIRDTTRINSLLREQRQPIQSVMSSKFLAYSLLAGLLATGGCQLQSSPENTVTFYLAAVKSEKSTEAFWCHKKPSEGSEPVAGLKTWRVTGQEVKTSDTDPDGRYVLVSASIEANSIGGFPVTRTWIFTVWKSDDLFESNKRTYDKFNKLMAKNEELLKQSEQITGVKIDREKPKPSMPDRGEITSKPFCILSHNPA